MSKIYRYLLAIASSQPFKDFRYSIYQASRLRRQLIASLHSRVIRGKKVIARCLTIKQIYNSHRHRVSLRRACDSQSNRRHPLAVFRRYFSRNIRRRDFLLVVEISCRKLRKKLATRLNPCPTTKGKLLFPPVPRSDSPRDPRQYREAEGGGQPLAGPLSGIFT